MFLYRHVLGGQIGDPGEVIRASRGGHETIVQELLGHKDVRTTTVYTHVLNRGGRGGCCPADRL